MFTNLPAWFVSGSSSSSMETLYDVFHCRMSQILRILRNKEGEPFSKHQASIVYVSIRFVAGGAPSAPFGAEVTIDVGVFFSSTTLAALWIGSLAFRFRVPRLPSSVSPFAEGSSFSEGAKVDVWAEVSGSIPDLPADFAPGSSSYSIDALFTIEFRVIAEIFSDFRKPGAGAFFSASSSFCYQPLYDHDITAAIYAPWSSIMSPRLKIGRASCRERV